MLATVVATLAAAPLAGAAPLGVAVTGVYEVAGCSSPACGPGDVALASGSITRGALQITVVAGAGAGLDSVRLEALGPGEPSWLCVHDWSPAGTKVLTATAEWGSDVWPDPGTVSGCDEDAHHRQGEATANGSYRLRVVAQESNTGKRSVSPEFELRLGNAAQPPAWNGRPQIAGGRLTFRWYRSAEPDVVEYRLIRTDSDGHSVAIPVGAAAPAKTPGCAALKDSTYACTDAPPTGRFTYGLRAYRPTPGLSPACKTDPNPCVPSASAATRTVVVSASAGTASASQPSVSVLSATFAPGSKAPSGSHAVAAPLGPTDKPRVPLIAFAAAALAALLVAHAGRARRGLRS